MDECWDAGDNHKGMSDHETGLARTLDPDTSHAAARSVDATKLEAEVYVVLVTEGGMTAAELAEYLEMPLNTISPRTRPLVDKGFIRDSGKRRATRSGRKAIVWEAVPAQDFQKERLTFKELGERFQNF